MQLLRGLPPEPEPESCGAASVELATKLASVVPTTCDDHGVPMVAAALQWWLRHPLVATTIPGAQTPEEAVQNIQAGSVAPDDAFWVDLEPLAQDFSEAAFIRAPLKRAD